MIPVDQVRTGYGRGQCTEASIASLLEVPLEAVPDLWSGLDEGPPEVVQPLENLETMWGWLKREHHLMECGVRFSRGMPISEAYDHASFVLREFVADLPDHLAGGPNPDGIGHLVVCRRGAMVHDPNPSRRGLASCTWVGWLVPLDRLTPEVLRLPAASWYCDVAR